MVKKTKLGEYDSNRSGGVIAINLRDDDEVISALLCSADDDLMLVSRKGQSVRFHSDDATLRPMARATQGVIGMKFRGGDDLLAMDVARDDSYLVTVTDGGFAQAHGGCRVGSQGSRDPRRQGDAVGQRERGSLVGALVAHEGDEVFAIKSSGEVIRTSVGQIRATGRDTMGVTLTSVGDGDAVVAVTRNAEADIGDAEPSPRKVGRRRSRPDDNDQWWASGRPTPSQSAKPRTPVADSGVVLPASGTPVVRQRRLKLTVTRVDPWTVLRLSFLLSIAAAIITVVALMVLWSMLASAGVFDSVDGTLDSVLGDGSLTITQYFSFGRVLSVSLLIAAIDVVLITALATIGAFLFNLAASLVGGLEVSVTDEG